MAQFLYIGSVKYQISRLENFQEEAKNLKKNSIERKEISKSYLSNPNLMSR